MLRRILFTGLLLASLAQPSMAENPGDPCDFNKELGITKMATGKHDVIACLAETENGTNGVWKGMYGSGQGGECVAGAQNFCCAGGTYCGTANMLAAGPGILRPFTYQSGGAWTVDGTAQCNGGAWTVVTCTGTQNP